MTTGPICQIPMLGPMQNDAALASRRRGRSTLVKSLVRASAGGVGYPAGTPAWCRRPCRHRLDFRIGGERVVSGAATGGNGHRAAARNPAMPATVTENTKPRALRLLHRLVHELKRGLARFRLPAPHPVALNRCARKPLASKTPEIPGCTSSVRTAWQPTENGRGRSALPPCARGFFPAPAVWPQPPALC